MEVVLFFTLPFCAILGVPYWLQLVKKNNDAFPADAFDGLANIYPEPVNPATARAQFVQFASHYHAFEQTLVQSAGKEQNISSISSVFKNFCRVALTVYFHSYNYFYTSH